MLDLLRSAGGSELVWKLYDPSWPGWEPLANKLNLAGPDLTGGVENLGSVRRSRYFFWYFDAIAGAR